MALARVSGGRVQRQLRLVFVRDAARLMSHRGGSSRSRCNQATQTECGVDAGLDLVAVSVPVDVSTLQAVEEIVEVVHVKGITERIIEQFAGPHFWQAAVEEVVPDVLQEQVPTIPCCRRWKHCQYRGAALSTLPLRRSWDKSLAAGRGNILRPGAAGHGAACQRHAAGCPACRGNAQIIAQDRRERVDEEVVDDTVSQILEQLVPEESLTPRERMQQRTDEPQMMEARFHQRTVEEILVGLVPQIQEQIVAVVSKFLRRGRTPWRSPRNRLSTFP